MMNNNIESDIQQSSPKRLRESNHFYYQSNDDADENNTEDPELVMIHTTSVMIQTTNGDLNLESNDHIAYVKPLKSSPKRTKMSGASGNFDNDMDIDNAITSTTSTSFPVSILPFIPHPIANNNMEQEDDNTNDNINDDANEEADDDDVAAADDDDDANDDDDDINDGYEVDVDNRDIEVDLLEPQFFNFPKVSTMGEGLANPNITSTLLNKNIVLLENLLKEADTSEGKYPPTILPPKTVATFSDSDVLDACTSDSAVLRDSSDCMFIQLGPLAPLPKEFMLNPRSYWGHLQTRGWYSIKTPEIMQTGFCYKDIDDEYTKKRFGTHLFLRRGEPQILQAGDVYTEKLYETAEMNINLFNSLFKEDICFPSEDSVISYCRSTYGIGLNNFPVNTSNTNAVPTINSSIMTYLFPDQNVDNNGDIV